MWLHSIPSDDKLFASMVDKVPRLFFDAINSTEHLSADWLCEACVVVSRYLSADSDTSDELPPHVIRIKSPSVSIANARTALRIAGKQLNKRASSLMLYHLSVLRLSETFTACRGKQADSLGLYSRLGSMLPRYAAECTFSVTGDRFIHLCLQMHLPSWCTMLSSGGCYRELSAMIPSTVNDLVRPYLDAQVSDLIRARNSKEDDIVLFVVACTLVAEVCGTTKYGVRYNREILFSDPDIPTPFVLCDFPVSGIVTDAYGFVYRNNLVVCNSLGVDTTMSLWLQQMSACDEASIVTAFVEGRSDSTNPLNKYAG